MNTFFQTLKVQFMELSKKNLKIFGISKVKTLNDFVTTENDVKKGNSRIPLNLARLFDEDLVKENPGSDPQIEKLRISENSGDDFSANMKHRQDAI